MRVNRTKVLYFIAELLAVYAIFNGDLPIRVNYVLNPTTKLNFPVALHFNLPVLLVCNRQELLNKAAGLEDLGPTNPGQKSIIQLVSSLNVFLLAFGHLNLW